MKTFITGIAGTGKTTVLAELQKRGFLTIDLDASGLCEWRNRSTGKPTTYKDTEDFIQQHGWYCDTKKLQQMLSLFSEADDVFIGGAVDNIKKVAEYFDNIFILEASDKVIHQRLTTRSNNHFGSKPEEVEAVLQNKDYIHEALDNFKIINTNRSPEDITQEILHKLS